MPKPRNSKFLCIYRGYQIWNNIQDCKLFYIATFPLQEFYSLEQTIKFIDNIILRQNKEIFKKELKNILEDN